MRVREVGLMVTVMFVGGLLGTECVHVHVCVYCMCVQLLSLKSTKGLESVSECTEPHRSRL